MKPKKACLFHIWAVTCSLVLASIYRSISPSRWPVLTSCWSCPKWNGLCSVPAVLFSPFPHHLAHLHSPSSVTDSTVTQLRTLEIREDSFLYLTLSIPTVAKSWWFFLENAFHFFPFLSELYPQLDLIWLGYCSSVLPGLWSILPYPSIILHPSLVSSLFMSPFCPNSSSSVTAKSELTSPLPGSRNRHQTTATIATHPKLSSFFLLKNGSLTCSVYQSRSLPSFLLFVPVPSLSSFLALTFIHWVICLPTTLSPRGLSCSDTTLGTPPSPHPCIWGAAQHLLKGCHLIWVPTYHSLSFVYTLLLVFL